VVNASAEQSISPRVETKQKVKPQEGKTDGNRLIVPGKDPKMFS
jgi:hypothetical protein